MKNKNLILELSGNRKYLVVEEIIFNEKKYYYLVNLNDEFDFMFGEIDNGKFIKMNDEKLICSLLLQIVNK